MKLRLFTLCVIMLPLTAALTCNPSENQHLQTTVAVNKTEEVPDEICSAISGSWGTFELRKGEPKQMCGNLPCGYRGPIKLDCQNGKITGSKSLIYASSPPPGGEVRAPIEAVWRDGKLTMEYRDSKKCLITYTVSIRGEELGGEYSRQECGDENTRGDFLAKRFPLRWTTDKSSQSPTPE